MYKITINWYGNVCKIDPKSDFNSDLYKLFPLENKSQEEINDMIYGVLDNLSWNHYGLFSQQTEISHIIIY